MPEELELLKGTEPFEGKTGIVIALNETVSSVSLYLHLIPKIVALGSAAGKEK